MVVSRVIQSPQIVRAGDGEELTLWRMERTTGAADGRGTLPILLVHGTFSNRFFFGGRGGLAQYLADLGYDAWVAELRGRRPGAPAQDWEFEHWIMSDAPALARAVIAATGTATLLWLGHSAGAVIGAGFAARAPEHAAMLGGLVMIAAPAPYAPGPIHLLTAAAGHAVGSALGRFPAAALRIGPADERPGILRQWFGWNASGRWIGRDGFDYRVAAARVLIPALAVAGAGDLLTPPSACRRLLDDLGGADRELVVCGRSQGFSRDYTHNRLVISAQARQEVWPVIARWIGQRFD